PLGGCSTRATRMSPFLSCLVLADLFPIFFFTRPAPTWIYTLSLHDALPIYLRGQLGQLQSDVDQRLGGQTKDADGLAQQVADLRSEEHTSELQSQSNLVCRLLLEKKKKNKRQPQLESKLREKLCLQQTVALQ